MGWGTRGEGRTEKAEFGGRRKEQWGTGVGGWGGGRKVKDKTRKGNVG